MRKDGIHQDACCVDHGHFVEQLHCVEIKGLALRNFENERLYQHFRVEWKMKLAIPIAVKLMYAARKTASCPFRRQFEIPR
jgi:hypothetical protein